MAAIMYVRSTILPELAPCVQILLSNVLRKFQCPDFYDIPSFKLAGDSFTSRSIVTIWCESNGRS